MFIHSIAIGFIIGPESIINITIYVMERTFSISLVFSPFSYVARSVWPCLFTKAIAEPTLPLTIVDCSSFKFIWWSLFPWCIKTELLFSHSFSGLFISEILATPNLFALQHRYVFTSLMTSECCLQ